jgi:uncharacterized protein YutE (UPF0331/DUF86 family)
MDVDLIDKKLAYIETRVRELQDLARPEQLGIDVRETRFVEHTLQLAIQAALDVASHIVSAKRLGEPQSNRELFDLLRHQELIDDTLAESLYAMAGFRNILVHGYQEVDISVVKDILQNHLDDLLQYAAQIRIATKA